VDKTALSVVVNRGHPNSFQSYRVHVVNHVMIRKRTLNRYGGISLPYQAPY